MLALLLLGAVVLRDDVSRIPPNHKWRYDRFVVTEKNLPVDVDCSFRVQSGANVHVELMTDSNLELLRAGEKYDLIQSSSDGLLDQEIGVPGTYAIVLWNDDENRPADVALKLSLNFKGPNSNQPRTLSFQRQLTVIVLSAVGFLAILSIGASQLLKAMAAGQGANRKPDVELPSDLPTLPASHSGYKAEGDTKDDTSP